MILKKCCFAEHTEYAVRVHPYGRVRLCANRVEYRILEYANTQNDLIEKKEVRI